MRKTMSQHNIFIISRIKKRKYADERMSVVEHRTEGGEWDNDPTQAQKYYHAVEAAKERSGLAILYPQYMLRAIPAPDLSTAHNYIKSVVDGFELTVNQIAEIGVCRDLYHEFVQERDGGAWAHTASGIPVVPTDDVKMTGHTISFVWN
jgi:hypothetical protein